MRYTRFMTRLWEMILVGDESGVSNLHMVTNEGNREFEIDQKWIRDDVFFGELREQIEQYLAGERREFDVAVKPMGTDFQQRVWQQLRKIPYGKVASYKEVATAIGRPKAARAVGMANSKNPIPLIIPCHRVVGSKGNLAGFAHGVDAKKQLLRLEGASFQGMIPF